MDLLIDWGNTALKFMLFNGDTVQASLDLPKEISAAEVYTVDSVDGLINQLKDWLAKNSPNKPIAVKTAYISSVRGEQDNKQLQQRLENLSIHATFAHVEEASAGIINGYSSASSLGCDRWLTLIAGHSSQLTTGIIDIGSAITLDIIDESGQHLGGHIVPGENLLKNSLLKTAKVLIDKKPSQTKFFELGQQTQDCVSFGVNQMIFSYLYSSILQASSEYKVARWLIAGGNSDYWLKRLKNSKISSECGIIERRPKLVFEGLIKKYQLIG